MKPKRLILSRKGFDSKYGGCPSPIFSDGSMFSLPIPLARDKITYGKLRHGNVNIGKLVRDLTIRRHGEHPSGPCPGEGHSQTRIEANCSAHLDPHINLNAYPKIANSQHARDWRGLLGQADGDETHLRGWCVSEGDLFLFFGSYQPVEKDDDGRWRFVRGTKEKHVLWGWLQIGEIWEEVGKHAQRLRREMPWADYHPHLQYKGDNNTLYVASSELDIGNKFKVPGWGVFPKLDNRLVLTRPGQTKSRWQLPRWFYPDCKKTPLSRHDPKTNKANRWKLARDGQHVYLDSVALGQEFVLDLEPYPHDEYAEALGWVSGLIRDLGAR